MSYQNKISPKQTKIQKFNLPIHSKYNQEMDYFLAEQELHVTYSDVFFRHWMLQRHIFITGQDDHKTIPGTA